MHVPINVKSPNNTRKWQMGFNSAFKGLSVQYRLSVCRMKLGSVHIQVVISSVPDCL
jgi:hypothetical protein